ncbi:MAG: hypothetical protein A2901_01350 [Elusimicrobia bacterium RIFCSPLOWO2_01_FULL_54_10]|nr:MAG: hypothetical protein A2901_01350 [Elusimicrobia bacterium RIFCSPLOWO2_01_FULL_54_10]
METKVLIVDDEPSVGEVLRDLLDEYGFATDLAADAETAVFRQKTFRPTVALVDYRLGAVTGLDLARTLRKEDPDLPVILMTAYPSLDLAVKAIKEDIYDFLPKPVDRIFLVRSVAKAIEHRNLVEENKRLLANMKRTSAMKSKFLSIVTHDLRTPLTSVRGFCDLLRTENLSEAESDKCLLNIDKSVKRMTDMVVSLMDLVSIEAGKLRVDMKPFDYLKICSEVEGMMLTVAGTRGVTVSWKVPSGSLTVNGDTGRIHQVLSNLISNALKHTPKGGRVNISVSAEDSKISTEITDTGEGISDQDRERIFEQFYQAESSTHKREGMGLGLAIAKEILNLHGGDIGCRSPGPGQGSTFYFTLSISK